MPSKPKLLCIVGPTASGKTAVGVEVARALGGEIISCDSMQVYRGMPIATQAAFPSKGIPAHLVSFLDVSEEYNAAMYRKDASRAIRDVLARHRLPILVGGTGLYLRVLLDGVFEAGGKADGDQDLRQTLLEEESRFGEGHLHICLQKADPASAATIHPRDLRRILRALEVLRFTGTPLSEWKKRRSGLRDELKPRIFFLDPPREFLYRAIEERVERMWKEGLVGEIRGLLAKAMSRTSAMALGVREVRSFLEGRLTAEEAKTLLKKNTRNYARRQVSWFRHEKEAECLSPAPGEAAEETAARIVSAWQSGEAAG